MGALVSHFRRLPVVVFVLLVGLVTVAAPHQLRRRDLGDLVRRADLVVRGTVTRATDFKHPQRLTSIRIERVLGRAGAARVGRDVPARRLETPGAAGATADPVPGELRFAGDIDHGVRYVTGERVVVFLKSTADPETAYRSPQRLGEKFRITSFDPTGYDDLLAGLFALADGGERTRLREILEKATHSHEPAVRAYAHRHLGARGEPGSR